MGAICEPSADDGNKLQVAPAGHQRQTLYNARSNEGLKSRHEIRGTSPPLSGLPDERKVAHSLAARAKRGT